MQFFCVLFHMQTDVVYLFTQLAVVGDPDILWYPDIHI